MGVLFKNVTQILSEACKNEVTDLYDEFDEEDILADISELEELEDDIIYTPEMVVIVAEETSYGTRYLVEYDNLYKLMESYDLDVKEALDKVCEHNMISLSDTYLVIESQDILEESLSELADSIHEAKCPSKKAKRCKSLKNSKNFLKDVYNKGIKVVKKKSKKK